MQYNADHAAEPDVKKAEHDQGGAEHRLLSCHGLGRIGTHSLQNQKVLIGTHDHRLKQHKNGMQKCYTLRKFEVIEFFSVRKE